MSDTTGVTAWRKSRRSVNNGACVEAGHAPGVIAVRDTRHPERGFLAFTPDAWRQLTDRIKETP